MTDGHIDVHGHSDDLIYVRGNVTHELHPPTDQETIYVGPYEILATYEGDWSFCVTERHQGEYTIHGKGTEPNHCDYSETVRIHTDKEMNAGVLSADD